MSDKLRAALHPIEPAVEVEPEVLVCNVHDRHIPCRKCRRAKLDEIDELTACSGGYDGDVF